MIDVNVDDSLKCFGVHWDVPDNEAKKQFEDWGFVGIKNFKKNKVLNGNTARTEVIASARKQECKDYFVGSYDWGVTDDSAIYEFNYSEYTGDLINGKEGSDASLSAAWSGHE